MYLAMLVGAMLPRGGELVFTSTRMGNLDIYLMDVSRALAVNITRDHANDCCAAWLPDGERITFVSWRDGETAVYIMDLNGKHLEVFGESAQYGPLSVSLSPDRQWIAYASVRSGNAEIYVVDRGGEHVRRLTWNDADDFSPRWRPG
jgi:TolB protein